MSNPILELPEIQCLDTRQHIIRIPQQIDVPLTPRVQQIIDTAEFRRLANISQLGLVSLVYPAAHHSRFEHSLGVFRMALLYLKQLCHDPRFVKSITAADAELFMVAALVHDLGHWPFCHPIEDIQLPGVPEHELFANSFLLEGEVADALRDDWNINPRDVVALLSEKPRDRRGQLLRSLLSSPIDVDKMDYLPRDSLHAGVPYGMNFDQQRLIGCLCINADGSGLALRDKGRTAAEMMVFARYVMFSEVYWHHAVRSATAMLQRAFFLLHDQLDLDRLFRLTEHDMIQTLVKAAKKSPASELLNGLFGPTRQLYKRCGQYSFIESQPIYLKLARRPYGQLVAASEALATILSQELGCRVAPHEILFDAPPIGLEVDLDIQIHFGKRNQYKSLEEVSPVVKTLAHQQFDDYVKQVRVFIHPRLADRVQNTDTMDTLVDKAIGMLS